MREPSGADASSFRLSAISLRFSIDYWLTLTPDAAYFIIAASTRCYEALLRVAAMLEAPRCRYGAARQSFAIAADFFR